MSGMSFLHYLNLGISVLIALSLHEFSHGYISYKLGDPTPKLTGRLTLNPLKHIDILGFICLFVAGFGWAKPVMIDYRYYKNKKIGTALVAIAGPCMNFFIALLSVICLKICWVFNILPLLDFFSILFQINIGLGVFNLLPFPPLDGSKILAILLPAKFYDLWMYIERYSFFILTLLLLSGILNPILTVGVEFVSSLLLRIVGLI